MEPHILGACASDRSIILYDIRLATPMRKVIMEMNTNAIAWNPMEAPTFIAANEDYNLYAFDMRHLKRPTNVHMDHVSAVTCVGFAPTGREFVSGSYDKTVRIFPGLFRVYVSRASFMLNGPSRYTIVVPNQPSIFSRKQ